MSEGDERFHIKNGIKRKRLEIPVKKALARGVALLGVNVTVYRLPIRLPAKSALTLAGSLIGGSL